MKIYIVISGSEHEYSTNEYATTKRHKAEEYIEEYYKQHNLTYTRDDDTWWTKYFNSYNNRLETGTKYFTFEEMDLEDVD